MDLAPKRPRRQKSFAKKKVVVKGPTDRNDVLKMMRKKGWFQFILDPFSLLVTLPPKVVNSTNEFKIGPISARAACHW